MYAISRYNYLIDYKGKKLLFNGLNGSGILMKCSEWEQLEELFKNLPTFEQDYQLDFNQLKHLGFIVDDEFDELAFLKHQNKTITYGSDLYHLIINPTMECNFHCWYCYEEHPQGHMTNDVIDSIKLHIRRKIEEEKTKELSISWFGGEPLLYFEDVVFPISKYAKELCDNHNLIFANGITTNGFCMNCDMVKKMNEINLKDFQITLDGNRERHNKIRNNFGEGSYDKIVNNINLLCSTIPNATVCLRINYDESTFKNGLSDILGDFKPKIRSKIVIDLHRVWQTFSQLKKKEQTSTGVINQELDSFVAQAKDEGFSIRSGGALNSVSRYNCYACRLNYACINFDGKVFKCTARSFSDKDSVGILQSNGSIQWNEAKISKLYGFSPMENKKCMDCKYLPLCLGPCPQHYMESNYNVDCILINMERSIENRIIDFYEESLHQKKQNQLITT